MCKRIKRKYGEDLKYRAQLKRNMRHIYFESQKKMRKTVRETSI